MLCNHDRRYVVGLWRVNYFSKPSKREASCRHVDSTFPRVEIPPFACMRRNGKALRPTHSAVTCAKPVIVIAFIVVVFLCHSLATLNQRLGFVAPIRANGRRDDSRHVKNTNATICYGGTNQTNSWFEVYTLVAGLENRHVDAIVRNTLEWTQRHGARFCVRRYKVDASRSGSWNKVAANIEALERSKATWALSLDADALIQNYGVTPRDMLERIEEHVGAEAFTTHSVFLSSEFGNKKDINPINGGVYFMRVNRQSIHFLTRVWNEFHGMSLFYRPYYEEQAAMRRFYIRKRKEFNRYAIILPFQIFNMYYKVAEPDDFLVHYAGYGTGRGVAKNKDKYDKLTNMLVRKFSGDREVETTSGNCIHDIAGLALASGEVYSGVTRYEASNWFGKLTLRAFPSKIERRF